jgi:hypothetical protein
MERWTSADEFGELLLNAPRGAGWPAILLLLEARGTARERLSALLDHFAYADISWLNPAGRSKVGSYLVRLVSEMTHRPWVLPNGLTAGRDGSDVRWRFSLGDLRLAQRAIRQAAEDLIAGRAYSRHNCQVGLFAGRPKSDQRQLRVGLQMPLPDAVSYTTLLLLADTPMSLLRQCPWRSGKTECRRVFVGKKRQKWCIYHQEAARLDRDRRAQAASRKRRKNRRSS